MCGVGGGLLQLEAQQEGHSNTNSRRLRPGVFCCTQTAVLRAVPAADGAVSVTVVSVRGWICIGNVNRFRFQNQSGVVHSPLYTLCMKCISV